MAEPSPSDDRVFLEAGPFGLSWAKDNGHRGLTTLAVLGAPMAILLAVFGLPSIQMHGPLHYLGIMGPTCGITRGVMWFTRGQVAIAWAYNPVSLLLVPGAAIIMIRGIYGRVTGHWLNLRVRRDPWMVAVGVVAVAALTVRQQLHVELLS